jgi:hypothetical protein
MLQKDYPDMRAVCNGFKLRYQNELKSQLTRRERR